MPLALGTRLGRYEITGALGKGGMGEVYRAKDTKLGREVAIKVLPNALARDPERLARFEREAKVLASLNHPNIATIYSLEESPEGKAIAMELVDGTTLKSPQPLDTALDYAKQIASALEAAHEKGVTHRDLKPANIMITPAGLIKVLDFGLAAVARPAAPQGEDSPTLTMGMTEAGVIMGTAAYMAPEQAAGQPVDRRADIWSFGVVLHELLTGDRVFTGETTAHILAAVIHKDPDFAALPERVRPLLKRCLQKDPRKRLQAIGDWDALLQEPPPAPLPSRDREAAVKWLPWIVAAAMTLGAATLAFLHFREVPPAAQTLRYTIPGPDEGNVHSFALSPDGTKVAASIVIKGEQQLWIRSLNAFDFQPLAGTAGAQYPFWSPDGRNIGFFADLKLKKISIAGGPAVALCDALSGRGGAWSESGVILFSSFRQTTSYIYRVSAGGGTPSELSPGSPPGRYPVIIPGTDRFIYLHGDGTGDGIHIAALDGTDDRPLVADRSGAVATAGHVLFVRDNVLMALPLDAKSGSASGEAYPLAEGVILGSFSAAPVSVSTTGVLLYSTGASNDGPNELEWFDRSGKLLERTGITGLVGEPKLSPDGRLLAYRKRDVWVRDLQRRTDLRITSGPQNSIQPLWSPNGDRLIYSPARSGGADIHIKPANGSGQEERLLSDPSNGRVATQWSGRHILFFRTGSKTRRDLFYLDMDKPPAERKPTPFLESEFDEHMGQLSPDSRWIAYTSDASGQREVYVRPFPSGEDTWRISTTGADRPIWSRDGKELFFLGRDDKLYAVPVRTTAGEKPRFEPGTPEPLFATSMYRDGGDGLQQYDVAADGKSFLVNTTRGSQWKVMNVVVNWNAGSGN